MKELGARGVQIGSNVNGRPLDEPEFRPLFSLMANWITPSGCTRRDRRICRLQKRELARNMTLVGFRLAI